MSDWCILRTSGRSTMSLAESLAKDGFDVWTPVADGVTPLTSSYVFARAHELPRLLSLVRSPSLQYRIWDPELRRMVVRGHPAFRLMRGLDPFTPWAMVRDAQLAALRGIEKRRKPRGLIKEIPIGAKVRTDECGFAGLNGVVESIRNKFATVVFDGFPFPVQVGCWLLTEELDATCGNDVDEYSSEQAQAA
jgi:transcription antitermination factor NusG